MVNAPVSLPSYCTARKSRNVLVSNLGLRFQDRCAFSNTFAARSLTPCWVAMTFRAYSTSSEFPELCRSQEGTVIRLRRLLSGKKHKGGACSLLVAGAAHI